MNQQQNKHSNKNYKRNTQPAKLLSKEYVGINQDGQLVATVNREQEYQEIKGRMNLNWYLIKTYKLNEKQITIKQKEN